ncbi:hypothetical protein P43SY_002225 [Pythium insidiosum]|uniref:Serine protease n=1 Tax=Pythium insidiosum TaxID=114742 RepID=A0AAD5QCM9_PYTIN|nr:hypothetical protein P43SY_002225 [Pythium insidiosum]
MVFVSVKKLLVLATLATSALTATAAPTPNAPYYNEKGILQIGTSEALNITATVGANREDFVSYPGASYISVKFRDFDLLEGDVVVVRSPDGETGHVYTGKGRGDLGTFVSSPIRGSTAIVEYFSLNADGAAKAPGKTSYHIEGFVRGFQTQAESICGNDQTQPAKCFQKSATLPQAYKKARAVARLFIGGSGLCTGWLIGSGGHLMTNEHCITSAADAAQVDIEFNAESSSCSDQCATSKGCPGTIVAKSAGFVANNQDIDYAVLKLPSSIASTYGYLQFRASGPKRGEQIYIPQHPAGWAKRISATVDGGAAATIRFTGKTAGCGKNQVGYLADTQGGSSGSPVIGRSDNLVVALHHCGGCDNLAVDPRDVLKDLKAKGISIPNVSK